MCAHCACWPNGQVVHEADYRLNKGHQTISIPLDGHRSRLHALHRADRSAAGSGLYQNNELAAIAQVLGEPKVLVVSLPEGTPLPNGEARPDEAAQLIRALQAANFNIETARPAHLPSDVATLADYASVVLVDVPARELSQRARWKRCAVTCAIWAAASSRSAGRPVTAWAAITKPRSKMRCPSRCRSKIEQRRPSVGAGVHHRSFRQHGRVERRRDQVGTGEGSGRSIGGAADAERSRGRDCFRRCRELGRAHDRTV